MTRISDLQKQLTGKYKLGMIATAEYRKNSPIDTSKIRWPVDDDLADARALTYRPTAIIHVYNDTKDREDNASIYWTKKAEPWNHLPRLMLSVHKNKITKFSDKLAMDLDPDTVSLVQRDINEVHKEKTQIEKMKRKQEQQEYDDGSIEIEADY